MEKQIVELLQKVIKENFNVELPEIKLENPPKKELGDFAFGCFVLAKDLKKSPMQIASDLEMILVGEKLIEESNATGPYLNLKVSKSIFTESFYYLYNNQDSLLSDNMGAGKNIVVDYIGVNVGKPLHIGHMCTPNIGQSIINVHKKLGYNVISDSHIGDWGIIFGKLITAYKLWGEEDRLHANAVDYLLELYVKISTEIENSPELEQRTRDEFKLLSEGNNESKNIWSLFTSYSIEAMNIQLARLHVYPQYNVGESFYEGLGLKKMENYPDLSTDMKAIVDELIAKKIATKNEDNSVGVVFPDEMKISSCILQKRDGTNLYLTSDLASIKYRMENWKPEKIIYSVDVRQQLHLKQAFVVANMAGWLGETKLFHAYNGFISGKDGAFATRKGNIIKLDKLLDEAEQRAKNIILEKRDDISADELNTLGKIIGIGAIKYGHLKKSRETDVIFDWDEFMTFEGNSGPYIQYAYVRARRILEKSNFFSPGFEGEMSGGQRGLGAFEHTDEIELVKALGNYKEILLKTADTNMPHHLCAYAYDLTKKFSSFYNSVHILNEENEKNKIIRLKLVKLFTIVLKDSFEILGIDMPEKM